MSSNGIAVVLSVIVPIHNAQPHLTDCLQTLSDQDLENVEFLLLDDGSTDESLVEAQQFSVHDPRFRVLSFENSGVGVTRNRGLDVAVGKYVAFIDPDDMYAAPNTLSALVAAAEANNVDICGGSAAFLNTESDGSQWVSEELVGIEAPFRFHANGLRSYESYQFDSGFWRFIYRRSFLIENDLHFPALPRYQDPPFFCRAMAMAGLFYALEQTVYIYRVAYRNRAEIWWTTERVQSILQGIEQELAIAKQYNLKYLEKLAWYRLCSDNKSLLEIRVREGDTEVIRRLIDIVEIEKPGPAVALAVLSIITGVPIDLGLEEFGIYPQAVLPPGSIPAHPKDGADSRVVSEAPLVSVIIPVFNSAPWLAECVQSVLSQPNVPLEIVLVNDGSTDTSSWFLDRYEAFYPQISVINKPNGGLSSARNVGIHAARGKYLVFLDSDDYWAPKKLIRFSSMMEGEELDVLFFGMRPFLDGYGAISAYEGFKSYYPRRVPQYHAQSGTSLLAEMLENDDYRPSACGYLMRRELLLDNNLFFIEGLTHEDETFSYQVLINSNRAAASEDVLYYRRVRSGSIMTNSSKAKSAIGKGIAALTMEFDSPRIPPAHRTALKNRADAFWRDFEYKTSALSPAELEVVHSSLALYKTHLEMHGDNSDFRIAS